MNERIKELAKEAAVVYQKTLPPATHTTPLYLMDKLGKDARAAGIEIISDGFCEKFAELIIRECADVCSNVLDYHGILEKFGLEDDTKFGVEESEEDPACPLCGEDSGTTCGMPGCQY